MFTKVKGNFLISVDTRIMHLHDSCHIPNIYLYYCARSMQYHGTHTTYMIHISILRTIFPLRFFIEAATKKLRRKNSEESGTKRRFPRFLKAKHNHCFNQQRISL